MAVNIIDLVKGYVTPDLISSAANKLGESEGGVKKALSGLAPVVLGGLVDKRSDSSSLLGGLKELASGGILSNLGSVFNGGGSLIQTLLSKLFGNKIGSIISGISSFAGIKKSSAESLLNFSSAATLGSVGKYVTDNNLDASGLENLLDSQKSGLSKLIPSGLSLGSLGLGGLTSLFGQAGDAVKAGANAVGNEVKKAGNGGWWKWLLALIILAIIVFFVIKKCTGKENVVTNAVNSATETVKDAANTVVDKVADVFDFGDVKITGAKAGGFEEQVYKFLNSDEYKKATDDQLKDKWFNFDNINFKHGSSTELEDGSMAQLENVANILKKFSDAKIKIGAYTDKTGSDATNKKVSQDRADFLKAKLTELGVGKQIVEAVGYGSEFAKAPATASDEERASDRKMAIRFAK